MEQGEKDVDFTKQLQNKVRNWRKKLDNIKQKETILKQGGELNETQMALVNSKESVIFKLEEAENILKMYQDYQAKKNKEKQIPINNQPLEEASKSLIELIHATYFLRYIQENQSELQQLFQSQEAQNLLQFGDKILPKPFEGSSYNNLLQSSLEYTQDFVQKSSKLVPNTDLTYQQVHNIMSNVEKTLVQQNYPARHVKVEIKEIIKEVQVPAPVPIVVSQQKQIEEVPVQQEQPQVQSQQESQQKQEQLSHQDIHQKAAKQLHEEEQENEEQIQHIVQVENTIRKQKEAIQSNEEQKASTQNNSQKGKQFDEDGFQIVTQVKKPSKQKEHQRGEGGNNRRGGNFHQGKGKRGGFEQKQS